MNDPSGITGRIPACSCDAKRTTALTSAKAALTYLADAERHWSNDDN
jgi:hypothetical protein